MIPWRAVRSGCGGALFLLAWLGRSQTPAGAYFRISVNLVQVDAVVTDSKGRHVRNLEAPDFQIFEDGKPQKITSFAWVGSDANAPAAPNTAGSPHQETIRKEDVNSSFVLMFDDTGTHVEYDLAPIFPTVKQFIREQLGTHNLAAVTASHGGMGFYQQFTNDKQQLLAAIDRLGHRPGFGMWTIDIPDVIDPDTGQLKPAFELKDGEPGLGYRDPQHPPNPIGHLMWAIQGLQEIPGRKAVILFTHSFAAPPRLIEMANRAGVVIHVIDVHQFEGVAASLNPYRGLARQTGGLFLHSAPGKPLAQDLATVIEDIRGYYLIGYRPERLDTAHHNIQVKVLRAGLEVRARNGYLGPPETAARTAPKTPSEQLTDAISSPFRAGKVRLRIDPRYGASNPDPKTRRRRPVLQAGLLADGRDFRMTGGADGKQHLKYSVLVMVADDDGKIVANTGRAFSLSLTAEQAAKLAAAGIASSLTLDLPRPGQYQIRAAVLDETSQDVGSAYQYVDVPDFNQSHITLSTIDLTDAADSWNKSDTAWTGFRAGAPLFFRCGVFGFRAAPTPHVDAQITLFRADTEKPLSNTAPVAAPAASLANNIIAGQLDLRLPPGDSLLELTARDRLASPKKQVSVQWTRFTVSPAP